MKEKSQFEVWKQVLTNNIMPRHLKGDLIKYRNLLICLSMDTNVKRMQAKLETDRFKDQQCKDC